jgi:hypothetical protein
MKKIMIGILLFTSVVCFGQRYPFSNSAHLGGLGPELIDNGEFASSANWEMTAPWTIGSGVASYDDTGIGTLYQVDANMAGSMEGSTTYVLTFDVTAGGGTGLRFKITNYPGDDVVAYANYATGSHEVEFTTASTNYTGIRFYASTDGDTGTIDNVSLKKKL